MRPNETEKQMEARLSKRTVEVAEEIMNDAYTKAKAHKVYELWIGANRALIEEGGANMRALAEQNKVLFDTINRMAIMITTLHERVLVLEKVLEAKGWIKQEEV